MNDSNLKPPLSPSEAREQGRKGGIASGQARREKKLMRERLEIALELPHFDLDGNKTTKGEAVVARLIDEAISGNVAAAKTIIQTIDGLPRATVEVEQPIPAEVYARVERILAGEECE